MMTKAMLDEEIQHALNTLLEDERASVEIEVALACGATELPEREVFVAMGGKAAEACCWLRAWLSAAGVAVSPHVNGVVLDVLARERYDERLRVYARHEIALCGRAQAAFALVTDAQARLSLRDTYEAHARHVAWLHQRAEAFARSRARALGIAGMRPDMQPDADEPPDIHARVVAPAAVEAAQADA